MNIETCQNTKHKQALCFFLVIYSPVKQKKKTGIALIFLTTYNSVYYVYMCIICIYLLTTSYFLLSSQVDIQFILLLL